MTNTEYRVQTVVFAAAWCVLSYALWREDFSFLSLSLRLVVPVQCCVMIAALVLHLRRGGPTPGLVRLHNFSIGLSVLMVVGAVFERVF